jgi:hypothetical protein
VENSLCEIQLMEANAASWIDLDRHWTMLAFNTKPTVTRHRLECGGHNAKMLICAVVAITWELQSVRHVRLSSESF